MSGGATGKKSRLQSGKTNRSLKSKKKLSDNNLGLGEVQTNITIKLKKEQKAAGTASAQSKRN